MGGPNWVGSDGEAFGEDPPSEGGPGVHGAWSSHSFWTEAYSLGTRLDAFRDPSNALAIFDSGTAADSRPYQGSEEPDAATQEWPFSVGDNELFAFRHPGLSGNFLFMDGHVGRIGSNDENINDETRFNLDR